MGMAIDSSASSSSAISKQSGSSAHPSASAPMNVRRVSPRLTRHHEATSTSTSASNAVDDSASPTNIEKDPANPPSTSPRLKIRLKVNHAESNNASHVPIKHETSSTREHTQHNEQQSSQQGKPLPPKGGRSWRKPNIKLSFSGQRTPSMSGAESEEASANSSALEKISTAKVGGNRRRSRRASKLKSIGDMTSLSAVPRAEEATSLELAVKEKEASKRPLCSDVEEPLGTNEERRANRRRRSKKLKTEKGGNEKTHSAAKDLPKVNVVENQQSAPASNSTSIEMEVVGNENRESVSKHSKNKDSKTIETKEGSPASHCQLRAPDNSFATKADYIEENSSIAKRRFNRRKSLSTDAESMEMEKNKPQQDQTMDEASSHRGLSQPAASRPVRRSQRLSASPISSRGNMTQAQNTPMKTETPTKTSLNRESTDTSLKSRKISTPSSKSQNKASTEQKDAKSLALRLTASAFQESGDETGEQSAMSTPLAGSPSSLEGVAPSKLERQQSAPPSVNRAASNLNSENGSSLAYDRTRRTGMTTRSVKRNESRSSRYRSPKADTRFSARNNDTYHRTTSSGGYCESCGGEGHLINCACCQRSFHLSCVDPPINSDEELPDQWNCNLCRAQDSMPIPADAAGIFHKLSDALDRRNPSKFSLPLRIKTYFKGITEGPSGEYIDLSSLKPLKTGKTGVIEEPNYHQLKDKSGRINLCHKCGRSALAGAILRCDYCPLAWHFDCLDPPLACPPPINRKWMCPVHADQEMQKKRKRKVDVVEDPPHPYVRNNGEIQIVNDQDTNDHYTGVTYRIPEYSIKVKFFEMAERIRQEKYSESERAQAIYAESNKVTHLDPPISPPISQEEEAPVSTARVVSTDQNLHQNISQKSSTLVALSDISSVPLDGMLDRGDHVILNRHGPLYTKLIALERLKHDRGDHVVFFKDDPRYLHFLEWERREEEREECVIIRKDDPRYSILKVLQT
ncbi:uncharacterized protein VTP21DRAFT_7237 [Calcarisporiella thermophila]|uniref:uncharacterized protein n=1 Tax=Calcarisporiella thermophila TaxID=911321 RepID=UPI00374471B6